MIILAGSKTKQVWNEIELTRIRTQ